jgi:hypothetical protein
VRAFPRLDCFTNGKLPRVRNDEPRHASRNDGVASLLAIRENPRNPRLTRIPFIFHSPFIIIHSCIIFHSPFTIFNSREARSASPF